MWFWNSIWKDFIRIYEIMRLLIEKYFEHTYKNDWSRSDILNKTTWLLIHWWDEVLISTGNVVDMDQKIKVNCPIYFGQKLTKKKLKDKTFCNRTNYLFHLKVDTQSIIVWEFNLYGFCTMKIWKWHFDRFSQILTDFFLNTGYINY